MKKILFSFLGLLALTIALVSWKKFYGGDGAVHASSDDCHFVINKNPGVDPNDFSKQLIAVGTAKYVATPSGNATLTCKASLKEDPNKGLPIPKSAIQISFGEWNDACVLDGVQPIAADDWQVTVTPSGNASAVCHWYHNK